ncbi:Outer membrane receptor for ferrienterochelin and colicins (FepA) (PDB:2HDF) (PUBMED:16468998) [Commensalibacter communis]|uniref:TonB-dependent receptor plug domain-containing protein n=1 Tax=Commensalibacter communis TaxID=2972786 RepID=UPI0022FF9FFD|nr:TonB-dependent receptor [Commensalibacter communis]CAI3942133.1 Outer membrane receptor for ferrienterochelin and colicins (FepA) (PDB:2HDF) (PUBMED:16468998) [Commensalibacter communis]
MQKITYLSLVCISFLALESFSNAYGKEIDASNEGTPLETTKSVVKQTASEKMPSEITNRVPSSEEITVYGQHNKMLVGSSVVSSKVINDLNLNTLDEAASILPGVNVATTGNSRNERMLYVRGFSRLQVPLLLDGIRVYLPYDNRLDFGRFVTPDIAEIQISKGYASVIDGPDGMGGMINLVTRKPKKAIDAEVRSNVNLDHDGGYGGYNVFGFIGTKQEKWYAQFSFDENNIDHIDLSSKFKPTPSQNKGKRLLSDSLDWRINTKIGITPNDTDEYVLSYTRQEGEKNAPLSTVDVPAIQRVWSWPTWNIGSLSFMSNTQLTDDLVLKFRIYRNTFDNLLRSFDNISQTTQSMKKSFNSYYYDEAYGGDVRLAWNVSQRDTMNFAFYGRLDQHNEHTQNFPSGYNQPNQKSIEESYSIAVDNNFDILSNLQLTVGGSYDWRVLDQAQGFSSDTNQIISYPTKNKGAFNQQARLAWTVNPKTNAYVSVSNRARFPSLFERFSTRFGGAVSNPGLKPERAQNYEIGASHNWDYVKVAGAVFYSHIEDAIISVPMIYEGVSVNQNRNVSHGNYVGFELSTEIDVLSNLLIGGNYTYIHRDLSDPNNANFRPTDVPKHKAFIYALWKPIPKLQIMPSLDIASNRWTTDSYGLQYYKTGHYVNLSTSVMYKLTEQIEISAGAKNLLDQNYQLAIGYPKMGRNFFVKVRFVY